MKRLPYTLEPFKPLFASTVASWVRSAQELFWLAPSSPHPLTAAKVASWTRNRGEAFLLYAPLDAMPCGYGELNPMRDDPTHLWLGHLIVDSQKRGKGIGRELTLALAARAFSRADTRKLSLVVFPENVPAIRCYERLGFRLRGEEFQAFQGQSQRHRLLRFELTPSDRGVTPGDALTNCAEL